MADQPKKNKLGLWEKFKEKFGGKEYVDLLDKSAAAYASGNIEEGWTLAHQADDSAEKHQVEAMKTAMRKAADFLTSRILGGEHVNEHGGAPGTPAKSTTRDKEAPKR